MAKRTSQELDHADPEHETGVAHPPSAKPIQLGNTILVAIGKVIATTS